MKAVPLLCPHEPWYISSGNHKNGTLIVLARRHNYTHQILKKMTHTGYSQMDHIVATIKPRLRLLPTSHISWDHLQNFPLGMSGDDAGPQAIRELRSLCLASQKDVDPTLYRTPVGPII